MKKNVGHAVSVGGGCLLALLLALFLLGWDVQSAAAQGIEQQTPMTGTMRMTDTMPMTGTMPMAGQGGMMGGDMDHMMEMMSAMEARIARMEARMGMDGSKPMSDTMPMGRNGGQGGMGGMMGNGGMGAMMGDGGMGGQGGMGGMMGDGGQGGMGGMMGNGDMMGHDDMHMMMMQMMQMQMMHMMMMHMQHMMGEGGMGGMMGDDGMGAMMGEGGMMGGMDQTSPMTGTMGGGQGAAPQAAAGSAAGAAGHEAHSGELGGIQIKVTPANLDDPTGETLDFTIDLEAQGQSLDLDLAGLAMLMVGSQEVEASGWTVNFDHGHHVNGTLTFPLADVKDDLAGATVMLHIGDPAGGGQAMFNWEVHE